MQQRRRAQTWAGAGKTAQAAAAHLALFCFTLLLALRVDGRTAYSWWIIFIPIWLFHGVAARGRFSMPAPSLPHGRHWAPCHSVVAAPLLIAFELLLCIYLESLRVRNHPAVDLKIVFLPLLTFEVIILIDNFRMCKALMPGDEESMSDEAIWETLPVDNLGTVNLVEACRKAGVKRFILVSSILVNGAAMGQLLNPAYIVLNLFGLVLVAKLQAEKYIRGSGINYTIVRPGGLTEQPPTGSIVMAPEDTLYEGSISRDQVAEVAVEALLCPEESSYKVVEIITRADAPNRPLKDMFASIKQK